MTAGPTRVVLADDTPEYRQLLRIILEQDGGFDVVGEAANGEEAVQLSDTEQPDVLVLDLAMPVMDGLQAIPLVRACSPGTAIVVVSGFARGQLERDALELGAVAYVGKEEVFASIVATLTRVASVADPV